MQHRKVPPLLAALDRGRASVGAGRGGMSDQVEDVHRAFPYRVASKRLADGNKLHERRLAAVHEFHCLPAPIVAPALPASPRRPARATICPRVRPGAVAKMRALTNCPCLLTAAASDIEYGRAP